MELSPQMTNGLWSKVVDEDALVLKFDGLKAWTPEEKPWYRKKPTKPAVPILKNVTGSVRNGEFVAVLGPSGAGKTTFLAALAGKCTLQFEGTVAVNGVNVKELPKGLVEIMPQFEVFMDSITVSEHLSFMTEMKLGSCKAAGNQAKLQRLMSELMLKKLEDSAIRGLSGGERRLLSLATVLISSPRIIICDEPTTGLDSYNASLVIGVLKALADEGVTVVCSIHQPSSDLFKEFNSLLLMAEGKLVFYGAQEECRNMFASLDLLCPKNYNPAEFYIRAISTDPNTNVCNVDKIVDRFEYRFRRAEGVETTAIPRASLQIIRRNWFKQVSLLAWRYSLTLKRDARAHMMQLFTTMMISSTIIAVCFHGIKSNTQKGIQDTVGFLWVIVSDISYGLTYNSLHAFEVDLPLFKREVGMYSCSAFYVSRFLCYIPRCIIWPCVFVTLSTMFVELPQHEITALEFMVAQIASAITSCAYGLGMGALFLTSGLITEVMSCIDLPLFLLSGGFLRLTSIPIWLNLIRYLSHFFYSMDALSNIYWRHIETIECDSPTGSCVRSGLAVLEANGYSSNFVLIDLTGFTCLTLGWCFLGYLGMKREERKGYAY